MFDVGDLNSLHSPSEGRRSVPLSSPGQSSCLSPVLLVSAESDLSKSGREEQQHASSQHPDRIDTVASNRSVIENDVGHVKVELKILTFDLWCNCKGLVEEILMGLCQNCIQLQCWSL